MPLSIQPGINVLSNRCFDVSLIRPFKFIANYHGHPRQHHGELLLLTTSFATITCALGATHTHTALPACLMLLQLATLMSGLMGA